MEAASFLILLTLVVCALVVIDHRRFSSYVTPVSVLGVPFAIVAWLAIGIGPALGFFPVRVEILVAWTCGIIAFWCGSLLVSSGRALPDRDWLSSLSNAGVAHMARVAVPLAMVVVIVNALEIRNLFHSLGGVAALATTEFQENLAGGVGAHLRSAGLACTVYLIGTCRIQRIRKLVLSALMIFCGLVYQVKYGVIVPVLGGALYYTSRSDAKAAIRLFAVSGAVAVILFCGAYIVGFAAAGNWELSRDAGAFLGTHLLTYLFSGVLAGGEVLARSSASLDAEPKTIVLSLRNLLGFFWGGPPEGIGAAAKYWVTIAKDGTKENVLTLFGVLQVYLGKSGMIAASAVLGATSYKLFTLGRASCLRWLNCVSYTWMGFLGVGWFSYFFWLFSPIEALAVAALLALGEAALPVVLQINGSVSGPIPDAAGE